MKKGISRAGFEHLVCTSSVLVRGIVIEYENDPNTIQDLVQETFTQAWAARDTFRRESSADTWLAAIARNVCRNHVRDRVREPEVLFTPDAEYVGAEEWLEQHAVDGDDPLSLLIAGEEADRLIHRIEDLSGALATIYDLHWEYGLSPKEIAERTEWQVDTVHRYISRVRQHLTCRGI